MTGGIQMSRMEIEPTRIWTQILDDYNLEHPAE